MQLVKRNAIFSGVKSIIVYNLLKKLKLQLVKTNGSKSDGKPWLAIASHSKPWQAIASHG